MSAIYEGHQKMRILLLHTAVEKEDDLMLLGWLQRQNWMPPFLNKFSKLKKLWRREFCARITKQCCMHRCYCQQKNSDGRLDRWSLVRSKAKNSVSANYCFQEKIRRLCGTREEARTSNNYLC
jgi:hypothetical protein